MAIGLSRTSVTNIEQGRQPIQLHTLYKVAETLGVEPTTLLPGASDRGGEEQSGPSLKQNEWLQKITSRGDARNVTTRTNTERSK